MKEYRVRVYDTFFQDWVYVNHPTCMGKYSFDEAVKAAQDLEPDVSGVEEVQVHVTVPTLGETQMVGYIDIFGEFVDCFC